MTEGPLYPVMAGLVPAIYVFLFFWILKTWMPGAQVSGSDAVLRTAMAGHDDELKAGREANSGAHLRT
jgi:hypothetical protein